MLRPKEGAVRASSELQGNLGGNSPAGKDRSAKYTLVFTPTGACGPLSASLTDEGLKCIDDVLPFLAVRRVQRNLWVHGGERGQRERLGLFDVNGVLECRLAESG